MKFKIILLSLFLIACSNSSEFRLKTKIVDTQLNAQNYDYIKYYHPNSIGQSIEVTFIKPTNDFKNYAIYSCGYNQNFILDNKSLKFEINRCDQNFPTFIEFKNNKSESYKLTILKDKNSKTNTFRIGYKMIIIPNNTKGSDIMDEFLKKSQAKNYKILWSKPIKFVE